METQKKETRTDLTSDIGRLRLARNLRRVALVAVFVFLALGFAGLYDTRDGEGEARGSGFELEASFPERARSGLDSTLEVTVTRAGGFDEPVALAVDAEWLSLFQVGTVQPSPDTETADPDRVIWEFEPPPGDTLEVSVDMALRPALRGGKPGSVSVLGPDDAPVATVEFETGVTP